MAQTVEVPVYAVERDVAMPAAITALLVVDMQNDFVSPGGALVVPDAAATVPVIRDLLEGARGAGARVFFTQDSHVPGDMEFPIWGEHALEGTWGWQIVEALAPAPGERVIRKLRYDGFFGTSLDHELRLAGVRNVVVCGTVANICVLHTAGSAALRGYRVVVPIEAISALTLFDMQAAMRQVTFLYQGTLVSSAGLRFVR
jgi:nicotinamidase-related amidase